MRIVIHTRQSGFCSHTAVLSVGEDFFSPRMSLWTSGCISAGMARAQPCQASS